MSNEEKQNTGTNTSVGIETLIIKILPGVVNYICNKIGDYFFYDDIQQEICLCFLDSGITKADRRLAFVWGWQAVGKFIKRNEINYTALTQNYEDGFNVEEAITKLSVPGAVVKDRRDGWYRENIILQLWKMRADGLTFEEIGSKLKISKGTVERYFKRSIHDQSIPIDIKYKALKQTRRRKQGKEKVEKIISELKNTEDSLAEIARRNNTHRSSISRINRGIGWGFISDKYPIRETVRQNSLLKSGA